MFHFVAFRVPYSSVGKVWTKHIYLFQGIYQVSVLVYSLHNIVSSLLSNEKTTKSKSVQPFRNDDARHTHDKLVTPLFWRRGLIKR